MKNRVNWGAITAGTFVGMGASLVLAFLLRAIGGLPTAASVPPLQAPPANGAEAFLCVLFACLAFASTGIVTALLGRFTQPLTAVLHALTALSLAYLINHYFFRDSFLLGRAGFPFDNLFVSQNASAVGATPPSVLTNLTIWTVCLSSIFGIAACGAGAALAQGALERRKAAAPTESITKSRAA